MATAINNLVEWYSERENASTSGPLTAAEKEILAADTRTSFKVEPKQSIPSTFMEHVLLVLPNLDSISFEGADTFKIDLSFITYQHKWPKLQRVDFGDGQCTDEDIRRLCSACPNLVELKGLSNMLPLQEGDALNVTWLHSCPSLHEVDLSGCKDLVDLRSFCHAPKLRILRARNTNVYDLSSLLGCDLVELDVSGCAAVTNAEFVTRLSSLKIFRVADTGILEVDWVANCPSLEELDVSGCAHLNDFSIFEKIPSLRRLICRRGETLSTIAVHDNLTYLDILDSFKIRDLSCLANHKNLEFVRIGGTSIHSIDWISTCENLTEVDLSGCYELHDLSPLGKLKKMHTLNMWCSGANKIDWIEQCTALFSLNVQWAKTADLTPISRVPNLKALRASGATECSWAAQCTQLEELDFSGSVQLEDFTPLGSLHSLKKLKASQTGIKKLGFLKQCNQLEYIDFSWCPSLTAANEISYCTNLKTFRAFCSALQEVTYITRLKKLERVEVYRCPLSKPSIEALQEVKQRGVVLQLAFFGQNLSIPS